MVQVHEMTTKTVKDIASAIRGKWDASVSTKCRYAVVGNIAFVECVGDIENYSLPVKPFNSWFLVASNPGGWNMYQAIIQ